MPDGPVRVAAARKKAQSQRSHYRSCLKCVLQVLAKSWYVRVATGMVALQRGVHMFFNTLMVRFHTKRGMAFEFTELACGHIVLVARPGQAQSTSSDIYKMTVYPAHFVYACAAHLAMQNTLGLVLRRDQLFYAGHLSLTSLFLRPTHVFVEAGLFAPRPHPCGPQYSDTRLELCFSVAPRAH